MQSVCMPGLEPTDVKPAVPIVENRPVARVPNWRMLVAPGCALALWLAIGIFLTWLLSDFDRALGKPTGWRAWAVLGLFVSSSVVTAWLYWLSYCKPTSGAGTRRPERLAR